MVWLTASLIALLALVVLLAIAPWHHVRAAAGAQNQKVRPAGVAGGFYPADPKVLTAMIDDLLAHATPPPIHDPILAAVAPHAGYQYTGPVAADTFAELKGRKFSRVVVIGPTHYVGFDFTSVYDGDAYTTPLGTVPVDKVFARQLVKLDPTLQLSGMGHDITPAGAEHSIEVELPWLQRALGNFQLVPIVMGDQSYESSRALGVALAKLIENEKTGSTLILASSDLSHYHPYDEAETIDHKTLGALAAWDYFSMSRNFETRVWEACGGAPIVAAMIAAERMGANQAMVLKYANSGDTAGDRTRVVGYSADVFVKTPSARAVETPFSLSERDKSELLAIARKSVEMAVGEHKEYQPEASQSEALNQDRGAFVTLREGGELRGCIGYTSATKPLYRTVRRRPRWPPCAIRASARCRLRSYPSLSMRSPCSRPCGACWTCNRSRLAGTAC